MSRHIDHVGDVFGRLTVLSYKGRTVKNRQAQWWCRCSCGNKVVVTGDKLRKGNTSSCGCYGREVSARPKSAHGGLDPTKLKARWLKSRQKKANLLGMSPQVARTRLVRELLFAFIVETGKDVCYRCGKQLSLEDYTLDHVENWLGASDPVTAYFDVTNIRFSHHSCNSRARGSVKQTCGSCGGEYDYFWEDKQGYQRRVCNRCRRKSYRAKVS